MRTSIWMLPNFTHHRHRRRRRRLMAICPPPGSDTREIGLARSLARRGHLTSNFRSYKKLTSKTSITFPEISRAECGLPLPDARAAAAMAVLPFFLSPLPAFLPSLLRSSTFGLVRTSFDHSPVRQSRRRSRGRGHFVCANYFPSPIASLSFYDRRPRASSSLLPSLSSSNTATIYRGATRVPVGLASLLIRRGALRGGGGRDRRD